MTIIYICLLAILNSAGQIFLAKAAACNSNRKYMLLATGYSLFVISVLAVQYLLKFIDFKTLSIVTSLNVLGVLLASVVFLNEKLTKRKLAGSFIVFLGSAIYFQA